MHAGGGNLVGEVCPGLKAARSLRPGCQELASGEQHCRLCYPHVAQLCEVAKDRMGGDERQHVNGLERGLETYIPINQVRPEAPYHSTSNVSLCS